MTLGGQKAKSYLPYTDGRAAILRLCKGLWKQGGDGGLLAPKYGAAPCAATHTWICSWFGLLVGACQLHIVTFLKEGNTRAFD